MALKREQAVAALFARLQSGPLASLVTTFSRAYKLPTDVQAEQQPALFLVTTEYEIYNPSVNKLAGTHTPKPYGYPTAMIIRCNIIIYATQAPDDPSPETMLNALVDGVEESIRFKRGVDLDYGNTQDSNLGGLVEQVTFIDTDPIALVVGTGSQQATLLVPVEMIITEGRT